MVGFNTDLKTQTEQLAAILRRSPVLFEAMEKARGARLKEYYIGAGCVAQTVWNHQTGNDPAYGISDIDLVYYDDTDLSSESENGVIGRITALLEPGRIRLDIKNQARVHLWYKEHFGYDIKPYLSIDAINSWPTTATSVGVRLENGGLRVYAPFGLNDMFGMIVRANKAQITEDIYLRKAVKWTAKWPSLTVIPW